MRIFLYNFFVFFLVMTGANAQNYHADIPVNKYYYQCASRMGPTKLDDNPAFKSGTGYIGLFQFNAFTAYQAGLCNNPVPVIRTEQLWKLCDFKGPVAEKYDIHSQYDLRFDRKAADAQFEMMHNLTPLYDKYIYQKKYDEFFGKFINGVNINPDVLRGLLHAKGRAAVDEFLHGHDIRDNRNNGLSSLGACLNQCMAAQGKTWYCD